VAQAKYTTVPFTSNLGAGPLQYSPVAVDGTGDLTRASSRVYAGERAYFCSFIEGLSCEAISS